MAPVKPPFSWPNSSDSISVGWIAPQLTAMKGPLRRALRSCTARATTSLPEPLSPTASMVTSVGATRSICASRRCIAGAVLSHSSDTCDGTARRGAGSLAGAVPAAWLEAAAALLRREVLAVTGTGCGPEIGRSRVAGSGLPGEVPMLAFGVRACHSGARLRGNFRQLCQTDTGNDRACPGLDCITQCGPAPADPNPQSGPCPPVPAHGCRARHA
ncbi:conserved protein of unknown function (plasmid) [Cupriavidus taiwanensis]|uniref:Uncharacterized protein n=1 Tax=Cupriavidus taiwanensis TaxID=164546 RepID=A0A375IR25_9BURK|nr:conserved protein of unknown function [Cupriavidus taiwanensis]